MTALTTPNALERITTLYNDLVADVTFLDTAPPAENPQLVAQVAACLCAEARLLDRRQFEPWFDLWEEDAIFWVPLKPDDHPGKDQSLILDDHRRLNERVWRMSDTSAWALFPHAQTMRQIGGVEAWSLDGSDTDDVLAACTISITYERLQKLTYLSGRQIYRLRQRDGQWRLIRKTFLCPEIHAGTPHLGWLL